MSGRRTRRRVLLLASAVLGGVAGCLGTPDNARTATEGASSGRTSPSTAESTSCRTTPTTKGTAVYEAAPPDLSVENDATGQRTVSITVARLPEDETRRPSDEAPHRILDLPEESTVFADTITLSAKRVRVYRCTGMNRSSDDFQVALSVRDGPAGAFDWHRPMGPLAADLRESSIEFALRERDA